MNNAIVRHLYAAIAATINDAAHLDIPYDAVLVGIDCNVDATTLAAGDRVEVELSTASVCQATTNDCNGVLANINVAALAIGAIANIGKFVGPLNVFLPRGTRVYINALVNGTGAARAMFNLYLSPQ